MTTTYNCPLCSSPLEDPQTIEHCQKVEKRLEAHAEMRFLFHQIANHPDVKLPEELMNKVKNVKP